MLISLINVDYKNVKSLHSMLKQVDANCLEFTKKNDLLTQLVTNINGDVLAISVESPTSHLLEEICLMHLHKPKPIVLFTHNDDLEMIKSATRVGVSAYVAGHLPLERITSVLQAAIARFDELIFLKNELFEVQAKLTDRKVIERAKGLLMKQRSLDEDEAYGLLRSIAMKKNMKLADLSTQLIETADMLIV